MQIVRNASGAYFVGGSQGRIADAMLDEEGRDTPMLAAIRDLSHDGGVIAGTSAGAAIMGQVMYRDAPSPLQILRHGVHYGEELDRGLGFLGPSWFVEQHCLVRGRFARAIVAMRSQGIPYGLGVDENTALVVRRGRDATVADLLGRLIDNEEDEAIRLAFNGLDAREQPSDGFEFRFYRGPDSRGWYTESFGGEDYTVLGIHLDIRPISIAGPLYSDRRGQATKPQQESAPEGEPRSVGEDGETSD